MSIFKIILFQITISLISLSKLRKTTFSKHGEACSFFKWCGKNLICVDYRCIYKEEKENHTLIEFSPNGPKCNFFHPCIKNYKCIDNYCQFIHSNESKSDIETEIEDLFGISFNQSFNKNLSHNDNLDNHNFNDSDFYYYSNKSNNSVTNEFPYNHH